MRILIILSVLHIYTTHLSFSQDANVSIDFTTQKFIGNESELSRGKYFAMHESFTSWGIASQSEYLFKNLGIEFGRTFGGPSPFQKSTTDVPPITQAKQKAEKSKQHWESAPMYKEHKTSDFVITDHPRSAFQLNMDHEKIANYNVAYIKNAYPVLPKYYEVMNEPFVHAKDYVKTWAETDGVIVEMSKLHKAVADKVHAEIPGIMVGGYCSAWPEVDRKDFDHWKTRMKMFMDTAGESMKFFATHIYDGRNVTGGYNFRSGSNAEGILDLIEAYSYKKWGVIKPHLISEYGYTAKGLVGKPYSPQLNGTCMVSYNNLLMAFLDKPDRLLKAIPFIGGESGWFYNDKRNPDKHPYPWAIIRKTKDGTKKFTELKKFYELWKNVKGYRVDIVSDNPDIQVNAFINDKKAYVALNNLHDQEQNVALGFLERGMSNIKNITLRRFYNNASGIPKLIYFTNIDVMKELTLKVGETVILECDLHNKASVDNVVREKNYYSKTYLQKIEAEKTIHFTIDQVKTSDKGRAAIKMGIGRAHDVSKKPKITINGNNVEVPDNWAGYDQANREQFFGVINVPVDIKYTQQGDNEIEITFPDNGGHVSSVILNIEALEK